MLTLSPVYVIRGQGVETSLPTGNSDLDALVGQRIKACEPALVELFRAHFLYNILAVFFNTEEGRIYVTLEKADQSPFGQSDSQRLRAHFDRMGSMWDQLPTLLTETEARPSLFYDDLGDLKLGFRIVGPIDYL